MALSSCRLMESGTRAVMPWLLLLCLAATGGIFQAVSQADLGFVSIDCGVPGEKGYVDDNTGLHYTTDAGFIDAGVNSNIMSFDYKGPSAGKTWNTVRSFPSGTRNCYTIGSLKSGLKYLIRGEFVYSNYDGLDRLPIMFDLYVGVNFWTTVNITDANSPVYAEAIVVVADNFVQVCLVNTGLGTPFINGLDLRPLKKTLYPFVNETNGMVLIQRLNLGPSDPDTVIRYPADPYDRIWFNTLVKPYWAEIRTDMNVDNDGNPFEPPNAVMQTAITVRNPVPDSWIIIMFDFPTRPETNTLSCISIMHFSELSLLPGNALRQFNIRVNGRRYREPVTYEPVYLKSGVVYDVEPLEYVYFTGVLETGNTSTLPPLINAIEHFSVISTTNLSSDAQDASTITAIKKNYQVHKNWMGDPCFPKNLAWDGLNCSYPVSKHPIIRSVNLSFSGLNGVISPYFANMKNLQYLNLSNNNLTGSIPYELTQLPSLMLVDVSNNQLAGSIPSGLLKRSQDGSLVLRYSGNQNLCASNVCGTPGRPALTYVSIVIVISVVIALIVLSVGVLLCFLQIRKNQVVNEGSVTNSSKIVNNEIASSTSNNDGYTDSLLYLENRRFTFKELEMITKNFQQVLGQGGFGCVYHGFLENGIQVAIKLLADASYQGFKEFIAEAQVLTRIHHKNLVTMIGYCKEGDHMALVYEYMPEGNLHEHIAGKDREGGCLTWRQRLRIALDSSQGLEYLHKSCNPPLIHRDVKTTNILLNTTLEAKVADFGLSKAFSVNSNAYTSTVTLVGTPGYVDPEYQATMQPSTSSDVYSFGVVLLELITGKSAIVRDPEPISLIRWVQRRLSRGDIEVVIDGRMQGDYDVNSVWKTAEIALKCTELDSLQRPTMTEVVVQLQECLELEENRIGVETTNELYSGSNNRSEIDHQNYKRASTMDNGPAAR